MWVGCTDAERTVVLEGSGRGQVCTRQMGMYKLTRIADDDGDGGEARQEGKRGITDRVGLEMALCRT